MANVKTVSMTAAPTDFQVQQQSIDRQRKLAEMLQQQAITPDQGQMVSGWYVPTSKGQHVAKLVQSLVGAYQQSKLDDQQSALTKAQQDDRTSSLQSFAKLLRGQGATPEQIGTSDGDGFQVQAAQAAMAPDRNAALAALLRSQDPALQQAGMQGMLTETKPVNNFNKVDPKDYTQESVAKFSKTGSYADLVPVRKMEFVNDQAVNPFDTTPGTVVPKQPNMASDLLIPDGAGGYKPNTQLVQTKKDIAKSGASNVNVKTDIKMNEGLAGQVGPMMKDSATAATGAAQQVDAAQRIVQAVDSGNVMAGPGASTQLRLAQIGQKIGVGGKDQAEQIANTRQTIRGLAELTLQGRKSMRGEGAITESEGALAQRAMSGDIDDLTPAEIKIVAKASERAARFMYAEHQRKIEQMRKTPGLDGVTPFYEVTPIPPVTPAPAATTRQTNGFKYIGKE